MTAPNYISRNWQSELRVAFFAVALASVSQLSHGKNPPIIPLTPNEQIVSCRRDAWFFTEERILRWWSNSASDEPRDEIKEYIERRRTEGALQAVSVKASDGRNLTGWRLSYTKAPSKAAVVVGPGNVASADMMAFRLDALASLVKKDFFIFDYRGYARSRPGVPMLRAFIQDFIDIGNAVRTWGYQSEIGYGPSLGGIVLAKAVERGLKLDRLVIDSIPSSLKAYDCDEDLNPVRTVVPACPSLIGITSDRDLVVLPKEQDELMKFIESSACKGKVTRLKTAIHALNDMPGSPGDQERLEALAAALQ